jgi:hypothetical protein
MNSTTYLTGSYQVVSGYIASVPTNPPTNLRSGIERSGSGDEGQLATSNGARSDEFEALLVAKDGRFEEPVGE